MLWDESLVEGYQVCLVLERLVHRLHSCKEENSTAVCDCFVLYGENELMPDKRAVK